ncbi:retrovirus-related Pol polyprotein from transposon 17.6 [Trichonephila clavipes]|nr:retrovirus-related Pol polyprotein from transposon 17.6 [Trichonephila clavipes]
MATPETAAVVIPPFIQRDPALWFYMIESTFELASPKPITESKTKYNYAVSHLPPYIATVIRDVIIQPDISDPYSELKAKIIERCSENKTQEIRRLLAGESLGDRKPSELLRIMKRRAENHNIDDSLLFELFNQAMPVPVQTILASISPITSDKASEVADRILAISPHAINAVSASGAVRRSSTDMLLDEVKALRKEIADLRRSRSQFRHSNNVRRKRSNSRSIDSGSDASLIVANKTEQKFPVIQTFRAANGTNINVYGRKSITVNFGLRRNFTYSFYVCNVSSAIIGADFLYQFNLSPDLRHKRLIDCVTNLKVPAKLGICSIFSVKSVYMNNVYGKLFLKYPELTKLPDINQPVKHNTMHFINTKGPPVAAKPRRLAPDRLKIAKAEFQHMTKLNHIRPSKSAYASPLHMVPKKDSIEWRPVGDYRALNAQTIKEKYPIPCLADFTSNYMVNKYLVIFLIKAYHQIPINPSDVHKTAICTPFGLFESLRMQFGLCNASSTFQQHLEILFSKLKEYGLCINVEKCQFGQSTIEFLGFKLSGEGIEPLPDLVKCILEFPQSTTLTQLRRYLGHKNRKKHPGSNANNPSEQLQWNDAATLSFKASKEAIAKATLLKHPIPGAQLSLWVDASNVAVGGSLMQLSNDQWEPLAFYSSKLNKSQKNWSNYDRELFSIYSSVKKFKHMLEGRTFVIYTDQKPLTYAFQQHSEKCSPRQLRHLDFISQFSTDIRYTKGSDNTVAYALSRIEIDEISPTVINFKEFASAQSDDEELQKILNSNDSSLEIENIISPLRMLLCIAICLKNNPDLCS